MGAGWTESCPTVCADASATMEETLAKQLQLQVALRSDHQPVRRQSCSTSLLRPRPPVYTSQLLCLQTTVDEETKGGVGRTSLLHYNPLNVTVGHGCQALRRWASGDGCRCCCMSEINMMMMMRKYLVMDLHVGDPGVTVACSRNTATTDSDVT